MRISFVNPPSYGPPSPPYGLVMLATIARRHGADVRIVDFNLWTSVDLQLMAEHILSDKPSVIAMTCWGNATPFSLRLAQTIRAIDPEVWLLAGGPMIRGGWDLLPRLIASFDILVDGEGEEVLPDLLAQIESTTPRRDEHGYLIRAGTPDIGLLPSPDWSLLDSLTPYRDPQTGLRLPTQASRGCAYNCSFCSVREFWGKVRLREPTSIVSEIERDIVDHGADLILFYDDNFTGDQAWVKDLLDALQRDLPPFQWVASTRVDLVPPSLARRLARAGLVNLFFGVESASEKVRRTYRKSFGTDILDSLRSVSRAGIAPEVSLVFGSPVDGPADMASNLDFMDRCQEVGVTHLHPHVLFPIPQTAITRRYRDRIVPNPYPRLTQPALGVAPDAYYALLEEDRELCLDFWMFSPCDMGLREFFEGFLEAVLKNERPQKTDVS